MIADQCNVCGPLAALGIGYDVEADDLVAVGLLLAIRQGVEVKKDRLAAPILGDEAVAMIALPGGYPALAAHADSPAELPRNAAKTSSVAGTRRMAKQDSKIKTLPGFCRSDFCCHGGTNGRDSGKTIKTGQGAHGRMCNCFWRAHSA
ncbi:MAG: hypothetical protein PHD37_04030 [Gallionellaceae bacterium]|nr:hypothetical protein [Gallionellaceae bacterium]